MKNFDITLYAFHLCHTLTDAPGQVSSDASLLWENIAKLGEVLLRFPQLKDLRSKLICYDQNGNYAPKREQGRYSDWLTDSGDLDLGSIPTAGGFKIQGNLQPFRLNDTYAVNLTLHPKSPDDLIEVPQLQHFNPQGCLLPSSLQASLGQTIWIYGEVDKHQQECESLASACAVALLERTPLDPVFVNQGKLFGSLLFRYEATDRDDPQNPAKQCHILVSLNNSQAPTPKLAREAHDWLLNLLCCYHKLRYVDRQSRLSYQDARQIYSELEKQGQNLTQLPLESEQRLLKLKRSLTELSAKVFEYDCHLRDLQAHRTTIETNATNYEQCLNKLPTQPDDDLEFWQDFLRSDCNQFQKQIQTDLSYLNPGRELFQQLIAAIRGVVEIEQAESDRQYLQQLRENEANEKERDRQRVEVEKERDRQHLEELRKNEAAEKESTRQRVEAEKQLENTIKAVTVGLTTGTSTASATSISFGRIDKQPNLPLLPVFLIPISILLSIGLGVAVGYFSYRKVKRHLDNSKKESQSSKQLPPSGNDPKLPSAN